MSAVQILEHIGANAKLQSKASMEHHLGQYQVEDFSDGKNGVWCLVLQAEDNEIGESSGYQSIN